MSGHSKLEEISEVIFQAKVAVTLLEHPAGACIDRKVIAEPLKQALAAYDGADSKGANDGE